MARPTISDADFNPGTFTLTKTVTVSNVAGLQGGATSGNPVKRGADMALWDDSAGAYVRPEQTNIGYNY